MTTIASSKAFLPPLRSSALSSRRVEVSEEWKSVFSVCLIYHRCIYLLVLILSFYSSSPFRPAELLSFYLPLPFVSHVYLLANTDNAIFGSLVSLPVDQREKIVLFDVGTSGEKFIEAGFKRLHIDEGLFAAPATGTNGVDGAGETVVESPSRELPNGGRNESSEVRFLAFPSQAFR
jgi:hypothetical protein